MAELFVGQEFPSWEVFSTYFDSYCKNQHVVYVTQSSKTTVAANKRPGSSIYFPDKFKYSYIRYCCKNFGQYSSKSSGIRPNQRTYKLGCPSTLYLTADLKKDCLVIKQFVPDHDHCTFIKTYIAYPEARRLTPPEKEVVTNFINSGVNVNKIKSHLQENFKKTITRKDINNIRRKLRERNGNQSEISRNGNQSEISRNENQSEISRNENQSELSRNENQSEKSVKKASQKCARNLILNQIQKFNKMNSLCQQIALICSEHETEQFEREYNILEKLLHQWKANGSECLPNVQPEPESIENSDYTITNCNAIDQNDSTETRSCPLTNRVIFICTDDIASFQNVNGIL